MNDTNNVLKDENTRKMKSPGILSPADIKQISNIISALNLIKMNIGMYPTGHVSIDKSVDLAYTLIQNYLQGRSEIIIGVTGKSLILNENALDSNAFREYAHVLNVFRVISLSLKRTVTKKDLFQFSRILSSKPSDIRAMGKLEDILTRTSVNGIQVKTIDAGYFQLADEKKTGKKIRDANFWTEFISRMVFPASGMELNNSAEEKLIYPDLPLNIQMLNDKRQYWQKAVSSYESMIHDYLFEIQSDGQMSAEKYKALVNIGNMINNLHPDLKEQLLDAAERQLSLQPETAIILENLKCFPREMLLEIIHLAKKKKGQISPTLTRLLHKLSSIEDGGRAHQQVKKKNITSSEMEKLLKREEREKYIPENYDRILEKLSQKPSTADGVTEDVFPLSAYLKTLHDEYIDFRICELMFALMEDETDEDNYLAYSTKLIFVIPNLIKKGQFSFLTSVIAMLRRHGQENPSEKIRRQAWSVLSTIADPDTVARYTTPFILKGAETAIVAKFLVMSGVQNIPWLFDLYLDSSTAVCDTLIDIIKGFGENAVDEASKRLTNQTPLKTIRLLAFFRNIDNPRAIPLLKELYECDDMNVKKEVLEILFLFNDSEVIDLLRKSIHSSNREEVLLVVRMTLLYEVRELMGELMSLLKTFYIREDDAIMNEWIVRWLGGTGNPWAVPYMEKIIAVRITLSYQRLSRMKEIIYESLEHFPRQAVQALLERGSKSWNRRIRAHCLKIIGQKES